jgi:TolB-like protein/DNA-binding winged helix-turn-helix (wHTH) protein/Tfp pilus assembly protein PilF
MSQHAIFRFDDFLVDPETWRLSRGGQEIHLEPVVLKLLIYLIANRDRLVTRQELMDTVWGDTVISESALSKAVARLRKALEDDPAAPRYLETVHSQGFRFVAAVEEIAGRDAPESPPGIAPAATARRGFYAAAAIVVLVLLAVSWLRITPPGAPGVDDIQSLAVLPLSNLTGDREQDYFVDGLQDILITELSQIHGLRVTSRQSTRRYRDSEAPTAEIAAELGVDALVEGSLLGKGNEIELTIQLVDGRSDEHLWAERYSREAPFVFDLVADVAEAIGAEIGSAGVLPGLNEAVVTRIGPIDPRAIDAYSLGLTHMDRFTPDGIRFAIEQFEKAVAIEPEFALGWGQLAAAHAMLSLYGYAPPRESIEKARIASQKAIEADDQFYIGHSTLGWVRLWTGDMAGACESFQEALRLNPSAPYALHGDADCLMLEGRMDESIARTREVLLVGPFSAMHNRPLTYHLFLARRFDEAITAAKAMQARTPGFSMHWFFARVYWQQGLFDEALEEERKELERRGDTVLLAALAEGLAAAGPEGALRAMAEAMVARANESYVDPFRIAETFARIGMVDEALDWLDQAVDYGSYEITYMAFQPEFDVLRGDPRFEALVERVYGQKVPGITPSPDPDQ